MSYSQFTRTIASSNAAAYSDALSIAGEFIVSIEVSNDSGQTMNGFTIEARDHDTGEWYTYLQPTDFQAGIADNILFVSADPSALTNGSKAHVHFRANGLKNIRFKTQLAAGSGNVNVRGGKASI